METTCPNCGHCFDPEALAPSCDAPADQIMALFSELFPDKPKPRKTVGNLKKLRARWRDKGFREGWERALYKAAGSVFLTRISWFQFQWFIRDEDNYLKLINETWKWKDDEIAKEDAQAHRQHVRRRRLQEEDAILANYKQVALQPGMSHDDQVRLYDKAERELSSPTATAFGSWLQDLWAKQERGA